MSGLLHEGTRPSNSRDRAIRWEPHLRKVRFAAVGLACFGFQYALLRALVAVGVPRPVGNGLGFALSAQANFVLSSTFTWSNRWGDSGHSETQLRRNQLSNGSRWVSYNAVAVMALVVNVVVFTSTYGTVGALLASAGGVVAGALVTYLVCDRIVFSDASAGRVLREVEL